MRSSSTAANYFKETGGGCGLFQAWGFAGREASFKGILPGRLAPEAWAAGKREHRVTGCPPKPADDWSHPQLNSPIQLLVPSPEQL